MITIDQQLFLFLNGYHSPLLDSLMLGITHRLTWIPLYLFIVYFIIKQYKRASLRVLLGTILAVVLSDRFTSGLMKPYFARFRPCHDPDFQHFVHLVGDCGGQYGFASSHAANSFALAYMMVLLFKKNFPAVQWLWFWALMVSYSRIYVGVHYPTDVLVGAIVGIFFSFCIHQIFQLNILKINEE